MKNFLAFFLLGLVSLYACNTYEETPSENVKRDSVSRSPIDTIQPQTEIIEFDEEKYVEEIDSLIEHKILKKHIYGWLENEKRVIKLREDQNDADQIYLIFQNDTGLIQYVYIAPISQSGDWAEYETYIFSPEGKTIKHEFHHSTFVSDCGDARMNIIRRYDEDFNLISEDKTQTDFEEKEIKNQNCFPSLEVKSFKQLNELENLPGFKTVLDKLRKTK